MMIREEFDKRVTEINSFYEILNIIELERPYLFAYNIEEETEREEKLQINAPKIDTLRSTTYLLLYNLIESTVYNAIESIFDEINDNGLKYFDVLEDIQTYWLNNVYEHDEKKKKETIIETIKGIAVKIFNDTITLTSNRTKFGGSLDAKKIFKTADSMKIDVTNLRKIYNKNTHGQILLDIKQKRNWLAHGDKSFRDIGGSTTFEQLKEAKSYVISFLKEFIDSVQKYIDEEQYKTSV